MAELKEWARRIWWAAHQTPRQKAAAVVRLLYQPHRFAREALRVFRQYATFVEREFKVSRPRQVLDLVWARVRYGFDPIAYYRFQFFRPERQRHLARYVQTGDTGRVLRWLVSRTPGYVRVFGDKRAFEAWCVEQGLPTVRTLVEFERGQVIRTLSPDGTLPPADLFSKPSNWQAGLGTERWEFRDGAYFGADGRPRDAAALRSELARRSVEIDRPILLQLALRNAAQDLPLTPGGLSTVRMTTVRMPGGEPLLWFAVYRVPADPGDAADNFGSGGLAAPVDLATGRLGRAIRKDLRALSRPTDRHPRTGALITGHELAHWADAKNLVLRAHRAITWNGVPVIGWDVALLDDGPLIVEANNVPCSTFAQMVLDQPLGETPIVSCINAHLRECFASPARP